MPEGPDKRQERTGPGRALASDGQFTDIYAELRTIARREHRRNPSATLNTTAVVHEAWMRLRRREGWNDREHYLSVAALAMRHVLVDHARYRGAERRDAALEVPLCQLPDDRTATSTRLLALDAAISELEKLDERLARLVVLRFFGGLTLAEAGSCIGVSARTAARDWKRARAFLRTILDE